MKMWTRDIEIWGIDMLWVTFELPESDLSVAKTKKKFECPKVDMVSIFEFPVHVLTSSNMMPKHF